MNFFRKMLAVVVTLLFACQITPQLSADTQSQPDNQFTVNSIISESFNELFCDNGRSLYQQGSVNSSANTASVIYDFVDSDELDGTAYVTTQIDFTINNVSCYAIASGEVEAMILTNNRYWEGCLAGYFNINDNVYDDVYVYFSKLDSSDDLSMSISIFTDSGTTSFAFGNLIIDSETFAEIESHRNYGNQSSDINYCESNTATLASYQPIEGSNYAIVSNSFTHYSYQTMSPYYSQRARAYYDSANNRLAVSLKTYASYLTDYLTNNGGYTNATYTTGIHTMNIALTRTSDATHIVNIENPGISVGESNSVSIYLYNFFLNILSDLGVPTSTIQQILGTFYGSFSSSVYANATSLNMQTSYNDYFNYDNLDYGAPIVNQLGKSTSSNGSYTYSTSVVYKTLCQYPYYEPATGIFQGYQTFVTYYDAGIASSSVTVYVQ